MSPVGTATGVDLRRAPLADLRGVDLRAPERDLWADEAALWDRLVASWAGLDDAAWHLPGAAPSDAGGPDWSLAEHVGHIAAWQELAIDYTANGDRDGPLADRRGLRRRRLRPVQRAPARAMGVAVTRRDAAPPRGRPRRPPRGGQRLSPAAIRGDAAWGWVYLTLHGHYLDHLAVIEPWADRAARPPGRRRPVRGRPARRRPRRVRGRGRGSPTADLEALLARRPARSLGRPTRSPPAGPCATTSPISPTGPRRASGPSRSTGTSGEWLADPDEGIDAWNERMVERSRGEAPADARPLRAWPARRCSRPSRRSTSTRSARPTAGAGPTTACTATSASTSRMLGPWCATAGWPDPTGLMPGSIERGHDRPDDRGHRRGRIAPRVPPPPARPRRGLHGRGRRARASCSPCRSVAGRRPRSPRRRRPVSEPAWSPDGRRLAYIRDEELWVVEADGSRIDAGRRQARRRHDRPHWSPDGRRLAFVSRRRGWSQVWIIDAPVPRRGRPANEPKVAGAVGRHGAGRRCRDVRVVARRRGASRSWRAAGPTDPETVADRARRRRHGRDRGRRRRSTASTPGARWLPDGSLLYVSDADGWFQVVRRPADGHDRIVLTAGEREHGEPSGGLGFAPLPSPDGTRFVHVEVHDGLLDLVVGDLAGAPPRSADAAGRPRRRGPSPRPRPVGGSTRGTASGARSAGWRTAPGSPRSARARPSRRTSGCCPCRASLRTTPARDA